MPLSFLGLTVALQTVSCRSQQTPNSARADSVPLTCQLACELHRAFAGPTQRRHRISSRRRIDQSFQRRGQFWIGFRGTLATSTGDSQSLWNCRLGARFALLQFYQTLHDSVRRHPCCTRDRTNPAPTIRLRFRRSPLTTHPFVHQRNQCGIPRLNPLNGQCILHGRVIPRSQNIVKLF